MELFQTSHVTIAAYFGISLGDPLKIVIFSYLHLATSEAKLPSHS